MRSISAKVRINFRKLLLSLVANAFLLDMKFKYLYVLLPALAEWACSGSENTQPFAIERFDSVEVAYNGMSAGHRSEVLEHYDAETAFLKSLYRMQSADSVMQAVSRSRAVEVFGDDIRRRLGNLAPVEGQLGAMFARMNRLLPAVAAPKRISGMVIPYRQSVVVADTVVLVGLNHYLGSDYPGYAQFDTYTRSQKSPSLMPLHIAEALLTATYPYTASDENATVLSRILYEGAVVEALVQLFPDMTAAQIMGYTSEQIHQLECNEATLWQRMITGNMLYSIDRNTASRLVEPGPATSIISPDAPPRAGRYIGWRIVRAYACRNHPMALADMLDGGFYISPATLKASGFSPAKR